MTETELNNALKTAWLLKKKYPDENSGYLIEALALEVRRLERERDELKAALGAERERGQVGKEESK